jgi:2-oxoglutarate ferredoxin oxidoreductase subunit alpha
MPLNDITIKLAGEAGQGVESSGAGFTKALARGGLHVFGMPDYMSRIRGGHNFYVVRASERPLFAYTDPVHVLLAFNQEAIRQHKHEIVPGGGIIFDEGMRVDRDELAALDVRAFSVPLVKIAEAHGSKIMQNTAAIGATAGLTGYDFDRIASVIEDNFRRKGAPVVEANLRVAKEAYDYAADRYAGDFAWKLKAIGNPRRMVLNGNQAFCLGAVAAGCKFIAAYPMTPGTSILEWMTAKSKQLGIVTKHMEDEIGAICAAIGAAHAGVRAMTTTSGGGFSLMVEALGLAGMTETPLVIVEAQRGGPSTGLPTRTEQSDLEFVIHASHGEFPRIVLAPGTVEECFYEGARAFNLAEQYQTPVIFLTDLHLASCLRDVDVDALDFGKVEIDRGSLLSAEELDRVVDGYRRHDYAPYGVSPRALPGHPNAVYVTTGDEHTEEGFITEDAEIRRKQMEKRMAKQDAAARTMRGPSWYGPTEADVTLMEWGSTHGAVREAVDMLNAEGLKVNALHFVDVWPMNEAAVSAELERARTLIAVEQNYTAQLANVVRQVTGRKVDGKILKYDGRPFSSNEIAARVKEEVKAYV